MQHVYLLGDFVYLVNLNNHRSLLVYRVSYR